MSEIEDQVSVFGAADETLRLRQQRVEELEGIAPEEAMPLREEQQERINAVAALLGPYKYEEAIGWFQRFRRLVRESGSDPIPPVELALERMAEREPEGLLRSRRLLAIAALVRAEPAYVDDEAARRPVVNALRPLMRAEDDDGAEELLQLLGGRLGVFWDLSQWNVLLETGLLDEETAEQTVPPCLGELIWSGRPGDRDPVPVLTTSFCFPDLRMEDLKRYLDPGNWPSCNPLWKKMERRNPGEQPARYLETISLNGGSESAWELRTCLKFSTRDLAADGSVVALEYRLCDERPEDDNRRVTVDQGTILARQAGTQVCIQTSKQVQFDSPIDGPSMAMIACALGWDAHGQAMVYNCLRQRPGSIPWPGGRHRSTGPPFDPTAVLDELVDVTASCLKECAAAYRGWYAKALNGTYTADDYVRSMADMWARAARDASRVAGLGGRLARSGPVATTPTPPPPHSPSHEHHRAQARPRPPVPAERPALAREAVEGPAPPPPTAATRKRKTTKKAATAKKTPRAAAPKRAAPKRAAPKRAAPKRATAKKAAAKKATKASRSGSRRGRA